MVFNATFNNISVMLWWSVLLVEETRVSGENHWSVISHCQNLSHNVVSSTPRHEQGLNSQRYNEWEWLLFNAKWAIFQLYHGGNKLHLMLMMSALYFTNIVLQMENCSDGFNVPREHTAKLYIVGKRIMGSIGKFCSYEWEMVTFF